MATIRDSIIAAASAVKGETVEAGPTISDALDALADALAGENVDSAPLIADEFAIMAQYLSSGGGGGGFEVGRMGSVELTVNQSYDNEGAALVVFTKKDGDAISTAFSFPDFPPPSFAQGVYVTGMLFNGVPTSGTYKVGDSGTPSPVDIFQSEDHGETATVFGFVMPDSTESNLGIFVDITAEAATEPNPGSITPA